MRKALSTPLGRWTLLLIAVVVATGILAWAGKRGGASATMARQSRQLSETSPEARAEFGAGVSACEAGDFRTGMVRLERAASLAPEVALIQHNLGVARAGSGLDAQARESFQRALELEPSLADSWAQLGLLDVNSRAYPQAEASLKKALALDPDHDQGRLLMANLWYVRGDFAQAEGHARQALKRAPDSYAALMALGDILAKAGKSEQIAEARNLFARAAEVSTPRIDPAGLAYRRLGEMAMRQGDNAQAEQAFRNSVERDPLDPANWYGLSRAARANGRAAEADGAGKRAGQVLAWAQEVKVLQERIQQAPGEAQHYFRLAAIEAQRSRREQAIAAYRAGLARDPGDSAARKALDQLTSTQ